MNPGFIVTLLCDRARNISNVFFNPAWLREKGLSPDVE
jgi:hypothetical protein